MVLEDGRTSALQFRSGRRTCPEDGRRIKQCTIKHGGVYNETALYHQNMEKIPHIIHYCWFGRNPKSELVLNCIESWKKYLPGYEIREWNEDNYDVTQVNFVKEAYENQKWAFVSDVARLHALVIMVEYIWIQMLKF